MSDHIFYPRDLSTPYPYSPDGKPIWPPETAWPDNWVTIGAMAAVTERLQFGTSVYVAPARDLFTVAKQVGTAAVLSGNRVNLGRGRGLDEARSSRRPASDYDNRGKRLDEMIPALRTLWSGGWVEYHGDYYDFDPLHDRAVTHAASADLVRRSLRSRRCDERHASATAGSATRTRSRTASGTSGSCSSSVRMPAVQTCRSRSFSVCRRSRRPDTCEHMSKIGVTGMMCVPWMQMFTEHNQDVADTQRGTDLERKLEATYRFGDQVIKPAADI